MTHRCLRNIFLLLFIPGAATASLPNVYGQAVYGTIIGTVADETGGVLPGAEVVIADLSKGTSWTVVTDESGNFRKERLVPGGNYRVTVTMPGFKAFVRENITVGVDAVVDLKVVLNVGELTEQITVTGAPPLLKTEKTDVAVSFSEKEVSELPIFERNFTHFLLLSPGQVAGPEESKPSGRSTMLACWATDVVIEPRAIAPNNV